MSLQQRARDRFRPWYLLDALAFLLGGVSPPRVRPGRMFGGGSPDPLVFATAVVSGLVGVIVLRFTFGNAWAYAVEYVNAGGSWTDAPLWAPAASGTGATLAVYTATGNLGAAAWTGFWGFAVAAGVAAVVISFAAGYRETSG